MSYKKTEEHKRKLSIAKFGKMRGPESPHFKNEVGNKYNMLTVLEYVGRKRTRGSLWLCKCECGGTVVADGAHLRNGHTKSCGCLHKRTGEGHPSWKGGKFVYSGYKYIYKPDHPNCLRGNKYVGEHTYKMSNHIGRALQKGEIVHHKNGVKTDNRISNLELRVLKTHPPGQSVEDLILYAKEILSKYEPNSLCRECHEKEGDG